MTYHSVSQSCNVYRKRRPLPQLLALLLLLLFLSSLRALAEENDPGVVTDSLSELQTLAVDTNTSGDTDTNTSGDTDTKIDQLKITPRIIGGKVANVGKWPSMVVLAIPGRAPLKDRFFCGGSVVAERLVLTAAHCLFDAFDRQLLPGGIQVIEGINDLDDENDPPERLVTNIFIHPEYDNVSNSPPYDIALLEIDQNLSSPATPMFAKDSEDYIGTLGTIVGWGATRYVNEFMAEYPTLLHEAEVPLVSLANCNSPISYDGLIQPSQLCAGFPAGNIDSCSGDSGGPLYLFDDNQWVQVGITSFGSGCATENYYGIYTNVSHFLPWLSRYMEVPKQSADLIARREAARQSAELRSSSGSGANSVWIALLLFGYCITRHNRRHHTR